MLFAFLFGFFRLLHWFLTFGAWDWIWFTEHIFICWKIVWIIQSTTKRRRNAKTIQWWLQTSSVGSFRSLLCIGIRMRMQWRWVLCKKRAMMRICLIACHVIQNRCWEHFGYFSFHFSSPQKGMQYSMRYMFSASALHLLHYCKRFNAFFLQHYCYMLIKTRIVFPVFGRILSKKTTLSRYAKNSFIDISTLKTTWSFNSRTAVAIATLTERKDSVVLRRAVLLDVCFLPLIKNVSLLFVLMVRFSTYIFPLIFYSVSWFCWILFERCQKFAFGICEKH